MASISEIAPDVYRLSVWVPELDMQFNHFLVKDEEPMLYHTGMRRMFPEMLEAVRTLIDPADLRWIGFSHFEVDECGALNEWLRVSPRAQAACSTVAAMVNLADFSDRPARALAPDEVFSTGARRFRFKPTPHLPHGWDAGVLFEETTGTLFCSDLFHHNGNPEAVTGDDIVERTKKSMVAFQAGPLMDYMPYSPNTPRLLESLAVLKPRMLATMHGSSFVGDVAGALRGLDGVMKEVLGGDRS